MPQPRTPPEQSVAAAVPAPHRPRGPAAVALAGFLLAVGLGLGYTAWRHKATSVEPPAAGREPAPGFVLPALDGTQVTLEDFRGQILLVDFWATWCGPCRLQAKILDKLHHEYQGSNVRFLAVSVGEPEELVREFAGKNPFPYPVLVDSEEMLGSALGVFVLPTVLVVDGEGYVSYLQAGISDAETLHRALLEAGATRPG